MEMEIEMVPWWMILVIYVPATFILFFAGNVIATIFLKRKKLSEEEEAVIKGSPYVWCFIIIGIVLFSLCLVVYSFAETFYLKLYPDFLENLVMNVVESTIYIFSFSVGLFTGVRIFKRFPKRKIMASVVGLIVALMLSSVLSMITNFLPWIGEKRMRATREYMERMGGISVGEKSNN